MSEPVFANMVVLERKTDEHLELDDEQGPEDAVVWHRVEVRTGIPGQDHGHVVALGNVARWGDGSVTYHPSGGGEMVELHPAVAPTLPVVVRALNMADGLMSGDPAAFKAGYSRENAELAVIDHFGLQGQDLAAFERVMETKHGGQL